MTFTSFNFLLFFPLLVVLYNVVPKRWRMWLLLIASYAFYVSLQPVYALLLACVTLTTYLFTRGISRAAKEEKKRRLQVWGIVVTVLPLFFFKYFSFVNNTIATLLHSVGWDVTFPDISFLLPVGISFYTFMAIGYIVDVYNEEVDYEPNIGAVGLFLSFFPLVLSGPIERAGNMLPQWKKMERSSYDDLAKGMKMMLWGYFMKLCVADRLGIYVDAVFGNIAQHNGTSLAFASLLYPFQVYADLGGYSLIAIGVARCIGIAVIPNFRRPFFATSMSEFWRRWHMSLIQWLTDYIYTPMSFALRSWKVWGIVAALMLTFLISGLWHGAAMTFIAWGIIQGIFLSTEALMQKRRTAFESRHRLNGKWWYTLLCCAVVFVFFTFSQIFGRCATLGEAFTVIGKMTTDIEPLSKLYFGFARRDLAHSLIMLFILFCKDLKDEYLPTIKDFDNKYRIIRWALCYTVLYLILRFGLTAQGSTFIYFQF